MASGVVLASYPDSVVLLSALPGDLLVLAVVPLLVVPPLVAPLLLAPLLVVAPWPMGPKCLKQVSTNSERLALAGNPDLVS